MRLVEELGLRTQRLAAAAGETAADLPADGRHPPATGRAAAAAETIARPRRAAQGTVPPDADHAGEPRHAPPPLARIAAWPAEYEAAKREPLRRQPAAGRLHRQALPQPRPELPRPDPGRQHGPDAGGRQVRARPRLQVLHLRHLVDSPGDHPGHRRPEPHHPRAGPHDRDHEPRARRPPRTGASKRRRADHGGDRRGRRPVRRRNRTACCG